MKQYKKIFAYFGVYKKTVLLAFILTLCQVIGTVSLPYIMSKIIDDGVAAQDMGYLLKMGALMLIVTVATCLFGILATRKSGMASAGLGDNLRNAMTEKLCVFSSSDIDRISKASFIDRMTGDVTTVQTMVGIMLSTLISAPLTIICITITTLQMNKSLSLIFFVAIPLFTIVAYFIVKASRPYFAQNAVNTDSMNRFLLEDLVSIRLVKAFVREGHMTDGYKKESLKTKNSGLSGEQITNMANPIESLVVNLCVVALLWFGGHKIMAGTIQVGELFSFITYTNQILYQIVLISTNAGPIIGSLVAVGRVLEVIEMEPAIKETGNLGIDKIQDGSVKFEHVYFDYNETNDQNDMLLHDINIDIRDKESIGIVGATGAGKTTLVDLIPRLFDISGGRIILGGCDIKALTLEALRKSVAFAPQRSLLFSGTVRDNLVCGDESASEADMQTACENACIYDYVASHDEGFDMTIEEGGSNVSGGQRQRLSLARAFIKKSRVLIMDDCTSALDKATERAVIDNIMEKYSDRTRILISGKISSIKRMDRIIVMDRGMIAGIGSHDQLIKNNGIYRDLCISQGELDPESRE